MIVIILLIIIISAAVYLAMKKNTYKQKNQQCTQQINESTFNPNYKISRDKNGLEIVQSCGN
jgi:hypothetical protein